MRLSASHPRLLEPLGRAVAPQEEVRKWMEGVFEKNEGAQRVWLATRLPREKGEEGEGGVGGASAGDGAGTKRKADGVGVEGKSKRKSGVELGKKKEHVAEKELAKAVYDAPSSMMPL